MVAFLMVCEVFGGVLALVVGLHMPFAVLVASLVVLLALSVALHLHQNRSGIASGGIRANWSLPELNPSDNEEEEDEEEDSCLAQVTKTLAQEQELQAHADTSEDDVEIELPLEAPFDDQPCNGSAPLSSSSTCGRRRAKSVREFLRSDSFNNVPHASLHARFLKIDANGQLLPGEQQTGSDTRININSSEPFEFDTPVVRGKLVILIRPEHRPQDAEEQHQPLPLPEKYAPLFHGKRRRFWIQLQVQFKTKPDGILFIGGEIPRPMKLGFFSLGLTKIMLSLVRSLVRGIHYSFGKFVSGKQVQRAEDEEWPHICFPLFCAVDQFIVTKPGETPPQLGTPDFGEPSDHMKHRRHAGKLSYEYNTEDIYSFHFHSYFLDFTRWKIVDLPGMRDADLKVFLSDMPLRIYAYNLRPNATTSNRSLDDPSVVTQEMNRVHHCGQKEYKLCLELSHRFDDDDEKPKLPERKLHPKATEQTTEPRDEPVQASAEEQKENVLDQALQAFEFSVPIWLEYLHKEESLSSRQVGYVFRIYEYEQESDSAEPKSCASEQRDSASTTNSNSGASATSEVPCRPLKGERTLFLSAEAAFEPLLLLQKCHPKALCDLKNPTENSSTPALDAALDESITVHSKRNRYRRIEEERKFLEESLVELMTIHHGTSSISSQIDRQKLFFARQALLEVLQGKKDSLGQHGEWPLLTQGLAWSPEQKKAKKRAELGQIVRIESTNCWRNEWLRLDNLQRHLRFLRINSSKPHLTIPFSEIVSVQTKEAVSSWVTAEVCSPPLYWLQIGTLVRSFHVAFGTVEEREWWVKEIRKQVTLQCGVDFRDGVLKGVATKRMERVQLDFFTFVASRKFRGIKRFVLNDRFDALLEVERSVVWSPVFNNSASEPPSHGNQVYRQKPSAYAAEMLHRVLDLQHRTGQISIAELLTFLQDVALLRYVSVPVLISDEQERKCFFLNVFHLLMLQAKVFGLLPRGPGSWTKFFNGTSYNLGGLHFSLAEIEHCVLRAPNGALRVAMSKLVLPRFHQEDNRVVFALTQPDLRINFALNSLTKSCLSLIPVFESDKLNQQLDDVMIEYLENRVVVNVRRREILLPQICLWYRDDFVANKGGSSDPCRTPPRPSTPKSPLLAPKSPATNNGPRAPFTWKNRLARDVLGVLLPPLRHGKNWPVFEKQLFALVPSSSPLSASSSRGHGTEYVVDWQEVCASGKIRCRFQKYNYEFQDQVHVWKFD